jgi:hypothetical protein
VPSVRISDATLPLPVYAFRLQGVKHVLSYRTRHNLQCILLIYATAEKRDIAYNYSCVELKMLSSDSISSTAETKRVMLRDPWPSSTLYTATREVEVSENLGSRLHVASLRHNNKADLVTEVTRCLMRG